MTHSHADHCPHHQTHAPTSHPLIAAHPSSKHTLAGSPPGNLPRSHDAAEAPR